MTCAQLAQTLRDKDNIMPAERPYRRCSSLPLRKDLSKVVFALLIVQSKPESSSMRAYLLKIRKALFPAMATSSSRDDLDFQEEIQHYKDALKNSEQLQKLLKTQNEKLEQDNHNLHDQLSSKIVDQSSPSHLETPKEVLDIVPLVHASSEPRMTFSLDELEVSLPNGEVSNHLRHLFSLNTILSQANANSTEIAHALAQVTASSIKLLAEICYAFNSGTCTPILAPSLGGTMQANELTTKDNAARATVICRTVHRILVGLDKLGKYATDRESERHVIHQLIQMFYGILELLRKLAESSRGASPRRKPPRKKQKRTQPSWVTDVDTLSTQFSLCELFVLMFANLQVEKAAHRAIMEGSMRCLLLRMGNILRVFVFDSTFEEESVEDTSRPCTVSAEDRRLENNSAMEAEAPYLLWLFEKIMALWQQKMRSSRSNEEAIKLDDRKTELQNTMLLAVFPNDHRSFIESLREPFSTPGVDIDAGVFMVAKEDIRNYFKQEVNKVLGWDVLGKVIAWD